MARIEFRDFDREFIRLARSLEKRRVESDGVDVANHAHPPDLPGGMATLRMVAIIGLVAAIVFVVYAFTIHPLLGVSGIFVSPAFPLGLTVLVDRIRWMRT
jgi:hypothetical protein